jgi:hypothetical protein
VYELPHKHLSFIGYIHRHLSNIECLMAHTACLVSFISAVNGRNKNKIKEAKNALEDVALVAGT